MKKILISSILALILAGCALKPTLYNWQGSNITALTYEYLNDEGRTIDKQIDILENIYTL